MEELPEFRICLRDDLQDASEFLPTKSEPLATGWDVRCAEPEGVLLKPFERYMIRLGFRSFCPEGWWYELKPRSSTFVKKYLHALYGTIDETYEKELVFACHFIPTVEWSPIDDSRVWAFSIKENPLSHFLGLKDCQRIEFGERIGQIVPVKRQEMKIIQVSKEEYDESCKNRNASRKTGGFGSSGNR